MCPPWNLLVAFTADDATGGGPVQFYILLQYCVPYTVLTRDRLSLVRHSHFSRFLELHHKMLNVTYSLYNTALFKFLCLVVVVLFSLKACLDLEVLLSFT